MIGISSIPDVHKKWGPSRHILDSWLRNYPSGLTQANMYFFSEMYHHMLSMWHTGTKTVFIERDLILSEYCNIQSHESRNGPNHRTMIIYVQNGHSANIHWNHIEEHILPKAQNYNKYIPHNYSFQFLNLYPKFNTPSKAVRVFQCNSVDNHVTPCLQTVQVKCMSQNLHRTCLTSQIYMCIHRTTYSMTWSKYSTAQALHSLHTHAWSLHGHYTGITWQCNVHDMGLHGTHAHHMAHMHITWHTHTSHGTHTHHMAHMHITWHWNAHCMVAAWQCTLTCKSILYRAPPMYSRWTPPGMYLTDHISPGLHIEFTWIPDGLHLEFRWSAPQVHIVFKK